MRVLLVEDDSLLGQSLQSVLRHERYVVDRSRTLAEARDAVRTTQYALALVDRQLPDGDGLDLVTALHAGEEPCVVLMLTARDEVQQRVLGLDRGADDYLVKPFDIDELLARMRAGLRRLASRRLPQQGLRVGEVEIDPRSRQVRRAGQPVDLPPREYAVLLELVMRPGRVLSRRQLEDALYAAGEEVESNAIEVHVHHLRRRLGAELIRTVRGHGYVVDAG